MERLTEQHFKKGDGFYMKCSGHCCKEDFSCEDCKEFDVLVDRLGVIEDILGDTYDIDRLRELVEADREGRAIVSPIATGQSVYFIETCEKFKENVFNGRPYIAAVSCEDSRRSEEFCFDKCEKKGELMVFEDVVIAIYTDDGGNCDVYLEEYGRLPFEEFGKTAFKEKGKALEALEGMKNNG